MAKLADFDRFLHGQFCPDTTQVRLQRLQLERCRSKVVHNAFESPSPQAKGSVPVLLKLSREVQSAEVLCHKESSFSFVNISTSNPKTQTSRQNSMSYELSRNKVFQDLQREVERLTDQGARTLKRLKIRSHTIPKQKSSVTFFEVVMLRFSSLFKPGLQASGRLRCR